jgi:hypothetical protein
MVPGHSDWTLSENKLNHRLPNGTYGGVRGKETKVGQKTFVSRPTRLQFLLKSCILEMSFIGKRGKRFAGYSERGIIHKGYYSCGGIPSSPAQYTHGPAKD